MGSGGTFEPKFFFSLKEKPLCSKVIEFCGISIIFNVNFLKFLKTYEVGPAPTKSATVGGGQIKEGGR